MANLSKKKQRELLRLKFGGKCAYCGHPLPLTGWHADHIEAVYRNCEWKYKPNGRRYLGSGTGMANPHLDCETNQVPACAPCNLFKSTFSVEQFRKKIMTQVDVTRRASRSFRTAEAFGQLIATPTPVIFYFEQYYADQNNLIQIDDIEDAM
ncbi:MULTISPECIES: HNH endonuclease [Yersinia pseudotuberculosis complex]|uniref:HNH endonuclease n=1 Tax=Yersinia pseudotuberculosis serotype O:1b (strain IP 31758) TaxID=349747 RepID=A0A0U1QTH7_YERP3|nr:MULTISPECIES: HNH endonuclease [Yersinia pseudotuberculosis complex]ABS45686.1 conserved hypothetical protein [Yersinia pseudotuberculosis IP 31758]MCE4113251.1 HNH endonuclease [Yersinia pseudotuberculosis]RYC26263.1 HNH endonuclease [Yersinia pseudotuberculosis]UFA64092.1 HNH endonuclease [Yersinia pseudotuberculosis]WLF06138.1 HNH endonuclease [Yersinia pseudotuberculosis]